MNFSKSLIDVLDKVINGITNSFGIDFDQFFENNKGLIIDTIQKINDYDLETYVHSSIFTLWLISNSEQEEHVDHWKNFIFSTIYLSNEHYHGDVQKFFDNGGHTPFIQDEDDEEVDNDFISDEVYGEVDPEEIEHLKSCFSL